MNKLEPCSNKDCAGINSGIDKCIRGLVDALNEAGFETVASCCGHRNTIGTIALRNGVELLIAPDYETARALCDYSNRDIHGNHKSEAVEHWKEKAKELERERNWLLSRVGVDSLGVYLPCGTTKLNKSDSLANIRHKIKRESNQ